MTDNVIPEYTKNPSYQFALCFIANHQALRMQEIIVECMKLYKPYGLTLELLANAFRDYIAYPERLQELLRSMR